MVIQIFFKRGIREINNLQFQKYEIISQGDQLSP